MMDLTFKERTFDEAFAEARRLELSSFMWKGRPYHTERADEQDLIDGQDLINVAERSDMTDTTAFWFDPWAALEEIKRRGRE